MRIAILSDIHANVTALQAALSNMSTLGKIDACVLLGDLVNYGPRPNEVIELVKTIPFPVIVNLWGNHEYSIFGGSLERFATDRGRFVLQYTEGLLTEESRHYLDMEMDHDGFKSCQIDGLSILFIHGSLDDPYWGKLGSEAMSDDRFSDYDYVISGHTHVPHYVEHFFPSDNEAYRNKKRTIFINPGSVGQPRNHNPFAQFGVLDTVTGCYEHCSVWYDVEAERILFSNSVDQFYKDRLLLGV